MLVTLAEMLKTTQKSSCAVGAFDLDHGTSLPAVAQQLRLTLPEL